MNSIEFSQASFSWQITVAHPTYFIMHNIKQEYRNRFIPK